MNLRRLVLLHVGLLLLGFLGTLAVIRIINGVTAYRECQAAGIALADCFEVQP